MAEIYDFNAKKHKRDTKKTTDSNLHETIVDMIQRSEAYEACNKKQEKELLENHGIQPRQCCNLPCLDCEDDQCHRVDINPVECIFRMVTMPPNSLDYDEYMPSHKEALDKLEASHLLTGERSAYLIDSLRYGKARSHEERWATEIEGIDLNILQACVEMVLSDGYYDRPYTEIDSEVIAKSVCIEVEKAMGIFPNITT